MRRPRLSPSTSGIATVNTVAAAAIPTRSMAMNCGSLSLL
jgi:hypothetical protein